MVAEESLEVAPAAREAARVEERRAAVRVRAMGRAKDLVKGRAKDLAKGLGLPGVSVWWHELRRSSG